MEHSEEIKKRMKQMEVRLNQYEQDFRSKKACSPGAAVSAVSVVSGAEEKQESDLKTLRREFEDLKTLVSTLVPKIEKIEKDMDDQEQYSRSNCLIVHGVKNIPKRGEYLDNENFICSELNKKLTLNPPIQASDLDIAHPLPSRKGDAMIVKFLRRTQRNLIYSKKRQLKGSGVIITESLTKRRLKLLEAAKSAFGRFSAWSMKGDVYVFHNKKHLVNDFVDINRIKNTSTYASVTTNNLTN